MKFTIRLSYNGNSFCGWQLQKNDTSIQGELQKALSMLLKCDIPVTGAGRTDAGVNAVNYVAHFDVPETAEARPEFLKYKLNAILPKGIAVHEIIPVAEAFHARFSAVSREYHYFIHKKKDPFMENFSHPSCALKRREETTRLPSALSMKPPGAPIRLCMFQ